MPFNWQPMGALQGTVPNQLPSFTPQNNEGLRMPGNQAMFNLPRFQMPGTTVNFGGMMPAGNMSFSITRQASSDPVQNIINDIQNPLGNTNISFGGSPASNTPAQRQAEPMGLRGAMLPNMRADTSTRSLATGPTSDATQFLAGGQFQPENIMRLNQMSQALTPPFSLRSRMLANRQQMPLTGDVFI